MNGQQLDMYGHFLTDEKDIFRKDFMHGYAETLRERALVQNGMDEFTDDEILTLIVGNTGIGAEKASEIVNRLFDTFGGLRGVLEARPEQLLAVPGVGKKVAGMIALVVPMVRTWHRLAMRESDKIGNAREAENYALSLLAGERIENFFVIALNARCKVLGRRRISTGSLSEVSAYPRMVMETALNYNAHSVLLTHNHPGGTCAPSTEDIASTQQLQRLLNGIGILVLDHIIVAGDRTYSMVQHGDITYKVR